MLRRDILAVAVLAVIGLAALPGNATAQQKSVKDQLVGTWTLLLDDGVKEDGTHVPTFGPNPAGTLILTSDGHFSLQVVRVNRPAFASKNRNNGTAAEYKAAFDGMVTAFGAYTVDPKDMSITFRMDGSSFPNWEGTRQKRLVTAVTDDVLTYKNPTSSTPGAGFVTTEVVWKKVK